MMGVLAALALAAAAGRAQTVDNWTSTSSSTWGAAGNWSVGIPSSADAATFNNTSGLESAVTLLAASSTGTLVFLSTGGATAYTFDTLGTENTNTLTIASGITNADTAALTFYNTTTLGGSQSWENDGGTMTFDGKVNLGSGANGFTLTVSGAGAVNIAGVIANGGTTAGSLTYGGSGTLTLTAVNTYTGATTINSGGTLQLGNGTTSGTIAATSGITDNGTLAFDETGTTSLAKAISGTGGVTQTAGTNSLTGANSYSGPTVVNGGTLTAGSATALGNLSAVTVNNSGVLAIAAGDSNTVGSIASASATSSITIGSAATTLTTGGNNASTTFAGVISGTGNLTEAGTGTLILNNTETFSDKLTINSGAAVQLGDGTTNGTLAAATTDNGTLLLDEGSAVTLSTKITGTGAVTQNGATNTTLSGTNTYSGATTVNGGTLTAGSGSAFGGASGLSAVTVNNSGILAISGESNTVGSIASGSATSSITLGASTLTTGGNNASTTFAGVISGTGGALTEAGTGVLTLNNADTYTGKTTINSGASLQLGDGTTNGTIASTSGITDTGTLILNEGTGVTISPVISGTGAVTQNGSVTNTLSGTNTYSGATTVNGGTLAAGSASAFGGASGLSTVTVNNSATLALGTFSNTVGSIASASATSAITLGSGATLTTGGNNASTTFAGVISGAGSLTKAGTGTLTLNNADTYTGKTTINSGGSLQLGDGTTNGTIASTSGITDNGTLIVNEGSATTLGSSITGTGGVIVDGTNSTPVVTFSGTNVYSGTTVVNSGNLDAGSTSAFGGTGLSAVTLNGDGVLSLLGFNNTIGSLASASATSALSLSGGATLTVGGNNTSTTFAGEISGGGGGILTKVGTGTLTLSNTTVFVGAYNGGTNINGGAISISADAGLGADPASATANNLNFNGGTLDTTATFTLNANRGVTLNSAGGTFAPSSGTTLTYGGIVAGTGALTVNGAGTVSLTGANTYTGATNLNAGTLSIGADNNLGTAPGSATANKLNFNGGTLATTSTFALSSNRGITVNAGGGTINVASGTTLTYGGLLAGTGALSLPGAGTLDLTSNALNFTGSATVTSGELEFTGTLPKIGTLTLGTGSTLFVNGSDLSVTNLDITGNTIIDFGSGSSILNLTNLTISAGATVTVEGWTNEVDYFYTQNWTGATLGTTGVGPETQVTFNGYSSSNTGWLSYDNEISPAPEPATYGAILVGVSLLGLVFYRRKRSAA
jgi:autotransporter-associated beta strand protein